MMMNTTDLEQLDIDSLSIMWKAAGRNSELKERIENELQNRIQNNFFFSREELFDLSVTQGHVLTIHFIPTTNAYESYGSYITVNLVFDEDDRLEILKNLSENPPEDTYGQIIAEALITEDDLTEEQIENLRNEGFNTNEILNVYHS